MKKLKPIILNEKKGLRRIRLKIAMVPISMVVGFFIIALAHTVTKSNTVAFILIFALFLTIIYLRISVVLFDRCPRCGELLRSSLTWFTFKCRNCGLRL